MKLTLIGGGGLRAPLVVAVAIRRAEQIGLDEICLLDTEAERLQIIASLCVELARRAGSQLRIKSTTDSGSALEGAHYILTSIRVGGDQGRVVDEWIAIHHGVLGQETTGPAGFSMALRSIPVILDYARQAEQLAPGAWLLNFTNPAGLVTQALRDQGFARSIGICDSANGAQRAVAGWLDIPLSQVRAEVFGLNHLSFARHVWVNEEDVLPRLLCDPKFIQETMLSLFGKDLRSQFNLWLNEYLYYYYCYDRALIEASKGGKTRGEKILEWNQALLADLKTLSVSDHPQQALDTYFTFESQRSGTYMQYDGSSEGPAAREYARVPKGEGYAGLAFDVIQALESGESLFASLNIPNDGAIPCLWPTDVVEVSCEVNRHGIHPMPIGAIPEPQELLIRAVKLYERLTVKAIEQCSRNLAIQALMVHPLVLSYFRATALVDEYLSAHAAYLKGWH
jgi:alpha-galactosidase/6-phospho-beta-glucosidase family protein